MIPGPVVLREIVDSATYPLVVGSAPDRFVRRLAALVGDFLAEADSPDLTDSADINLTIMWPDAPGRGVSINLDLPGERGYGPVQEWRAIGSSGVNVGLELTLLYEAGEPEFEHAIGMLRAHGALPKAMP